MSHVNLKRSLALCAGALCCAAAIPAAGGAVSAHASRAATKAVTVADDYYGPTKVTLKKGGAVNFVWNRANYDSHNVTLIKAPRGVRRGTFTSVTGTSGIHFKRSFLTPGTYHFECTIHPGTMNLTIVVTR